MMKGGIWVELCFCCVFQCRLVTVRTGKVLQNQDAPLCCKSNILAHRHISMSIQIRLSTKEEEIFVTAK